jgi:hypothetical protein
MVADAVLKRDEERRRRFDEGVEEDQEVVENVPAGNAPGEMKPKIVAKTRVRDDSTKGLFLIPQLRFTDSEVAEMRSSGLPTRESALWKTLKIINQDPRLSIV